MSERENNVASKSSRKTPNRKERRQINFRVSESEYSKLQQSAETLNMSVPAFAKKKAQGARIVTPKMDKKSTLSAIQELNQIGNNMNQIAKYCNSHKDGNPNWEDLNRNIEILQERVESLWQQLN